MLQHKQHVINHAHISERKLDWVAGDAAPVTLQVAINTLLADTQNTTHQVEENLPDAPAAGALVARISKQLRRKLDEGDQQLDVAQRIHDIEIAPVGGRIDVSPGSGGAYDEVYRAHADDAAGYQTQCETAWAAAGVRGKGPRSAGEVLRDGDDAYNGGVQGEDDVVEGNGGRVALVSGGILFADAVRVVQRQVVREICDEAEYVEERKVDGGAGGGFAAKVEKRLRVEGEAPEDGVYPAKQNGEEFKEADHV